MRALFVLLLLSVVASAGEVVTAAFNVSLPDGWEQDSKEEHPESSIESRSWGKGDMAFSVFATSKSSGVTPEFLVRHQLNAVLTDKAASDLKFLESPAKWEGRVLIESKMLAFSLDGEKTCIRLMSFEAQNRVYLIVEGASNSESFDAPDFVAIRSSFRVKKSPQVSAK